MSRGVKIATAVAGLVAYLYLLGGIVTWLHFTTAQLPGDAGTEAISSRRLLAVGCRVVAFEVLLLLAVCALVTSLVVIAFVRREHLPKPVAADLGSLAQKWRHLWTLGGMIAPAVAWLLIALGLSVESPLLRWSLLVVGVAFGVAVAVTMVLRAPRKVDGVEQNPRWRMWIRRCGDWVREHGYLRAVQVVAVATLLLNGAVALFVVPVLQGVILLAGTAVIYAGAFLRWPSSERLKELRGELITSSGVWVGIAAATAVALAWVATPPVSFTKTTVSLTDGTTVRGAYIARNGEGIFVGRCKPSSLTATHPNSTESEIEFIPSDEFTRVGIGGGNYVFDSGGRPSLAEAIAAAVGGGSAADQHALTHHALRGRAEHVCGGVR